MNKKIRSHDQGMRLQESFFYIHRLWKKSKLFPKHVNNVLNEHNTPKRTQTSTCSHSQSNNSWTQTYWSFTAALIKQPEESTDQITKT